MCFQARSRPYAFAFVIVLFGEEACAQRSQPDTLHALRVTERMVLDGALDEACWQRAIHITNFTQRDPVQGEPGTDLTDVAVVYDDLALYVGAVLPVTDPEHMQAKYMERDFAWYADDNFQFVISTFNDHRNGYLFVTNPNAARGDMQVSPNSDFNTDWNGVWDVATTCTDIGWTAEFRIPFNTLQFPKDSVHVWGINFERNVRSKNEQVNWQGWGRNTEIENLGNTGTLIGVRNIGYAKRFEFKPYGLGGVQQAAGKDDALTGKLGGDLNVNISPTLKLNLTANTDFAQVEVDRIPVNLTRFNLYYPEKRAFFLEGAGNFEFYLGNGNQAFYTRRIGIENLRSVAILGGARLFGKVDRSTVGFLNIQTEGADSTPSANSTVLRYKYDLGRQSSIGALLTSRNSSAVNSQVAGLDGHYTTNTFLGNKTLDISGSFAQNITDGTPDEHGMAWRAYVDYPNDLIDHFIALSSVQRGFDPRLGFIQRGAYEAFNWHLDITPRWLGKYGVRKVLFQPWSLDVFRDDVTHALQTINFSTSPFGLLLKSGDVCGVDLYLNEDHVPEAFSIGEDVVIMPGTYRYRSLDLFLQTFRGRRVSLEFNPHWGGYYQGRLTSIPTTLTTNFNKHLNITTAYTINVLRFPGADDSGKVEVITNEFAVYPNYAFTPNLNVSVFGQWNSLEDFVRLNARLHWIPKIGTDLFLVFDQSHSPAGRMDFARPTSRSIVGKLVWRVVF